MADVEYFIVALAFSYVKYSDPNNLIDMAKF